ncbi:cupin [Phyllobacterium sophorae]|uniref:Cupin n=2 Tax=Phyllobacterium sophorae TaxID=1520277 RepID=A0A2P7B732_9HYPH|nr:cupin [Phyllobacterium sophorae]
MTSRLAVVELAGEIGALEGHVLRMSKTTIEAGGSYAPHSHAGRPEVIYVLEGIFTDRRGGTETNYGPGEVISMTDGVTHSIANETDEPVTYISVTVRRP